MRMNTQIKSHWRLAYRTFKKALSVTFSLMGRSLRANKYSFKVYHQLERQRELFAMIPDREAVE